jgi:hypothetical protein
MKTSNVVKDAVAQFKKDVSDWKTLDQDELYGELESIIDGLLYEPEYAHYGYLSDDGFSGDEVILERLIFDAIKKCQRRGKRHTCDPYYDDAFEGHDCMSDVEG